MDDELPEGLGGSIDGVLLSIFDLTAPTDHTTLRSLVSSGVAVIVCAGKRRAAGAADWQRALRAPGPQDSGILGRRERLHLQERKVSSRPALAGRPCVLMGVAVVCPGPNTRHTACVMSAAHYWHTVRTAHPSADAQTFSFPWPQVQLLSV